MRRETTTTTLVGRRFPDAKSNRGATTSTLVATITIIIRAYHLLYPARVRHVKCVLFVEQVLPIDVSRVSLPHAFLQRGHNWNNRRIDACLKANVSKFIGRAFKNHAFHAAELNSVVCYWRSLIGVRSCGIAAG